MRSTCRPRWARAVVERALLAAAAIAAALCAGAVRAEPATHVIVIEGMRFVPETLTVHRGDRIEWRNRDLVPHTATATGRFDSKAIPPSGAWATVAAKAGTLHYVCSYHPTMKGVLNVQ